VVVSRLTRSINVIKPEPPTFCTYDTNVAPIKIFRLYEKKTGQKILLRNWSEVPTINAEENEETRQY